MQTIFFFFKKPVLLEFVLVKRHGVALKCHSIRCFSKARALKFMETRLTQNSTFSHFAQEQSHREVKAGEVINFPFLLA